MVINGYQIRFFESIDQIYDVWDSVAGDDIFLQSIFLRGLEEAPPSGTKYIYVTVSNDDDVKGIVYFQYKKVKLYDSLRLDQKSPDTFRQKIIHAIKCVVAKRLNAFLLVCGNMTLTGNHGFRFKDLDEEECYDLIENITRNLVKMLYKMGVPVWVKLIKDFYSAKEKPARKWSYTQFEVQPNMILTIMPEWNTFQDYLMAMKSKYRVRVRRARKKASSLERRVLTLEEIGLLREDFHRLYLNVVNQADFNLFILPVDYFYSLKKNMRDSMNVFGYFDGGRLVGFCTLITNGNELDAHFLGYDPKCNAECQLYLNMLYDMVDAAIQKKAEKLVMSRTAMEIKSSVGAKSYDMHLYLKATNVLVNIFVKRALIFFIPKVSWQPRSPFNF